MDLSYLKGVKAEKPEEQTNLPDGDYKVLVEEFQNWQTKTGKDCLKVTFKVTEGEHKNRKIWYYLNLPSGHAEDWEIQKIQKFIWFFNPQCVDASEFFDVMTYRNYLDKQFVVTLKTKGDFQNCYIKCALDTVIEQKEQPVGFDPFA